MILAHFGVTIIKVDNMVNYREILRYIHLGYTQREIARSLHCSRNTVRDVHYMSKETGVTWPLDDNITNMELAKMFHPGKEETHSPYKEPDYAYCSCSSRVGSLSSPMNETKISGYCLWLIFLVSTSLFLTIDKISSLFHSIHIGHEDIMHFVKE